MATTSRPFTTALSSKTRIRASPAPITPPYHSTVVPEAKLERTEAGLVPASVGWFVMNARDARWFHRPGRDSLPLTGDDQVEAETYFPMLGMSIQVLAPGEPNSMYH